MPDDSAADLRETRELHELIGMEIQNLNSALNEARAEIERLNAEIARLRAAPSARVVEAARRLKELWQRPGHRYDNEQFLLENALGEALAEHDAAPPDDGWRPEDWAGYSAPNWDGDGAEPISMEARNNAALLWNSLGRRPDAAPGADGTIGFQWSCGDGGFLIIEAGPGRLLSIRRIPPPPDAAGLRDPAKEAKGEAFDPLRASDPWAIDGPQRGPGDG